MPQAGATPANTHDDATNLAKSMCSEQQALQWAGELIDIDSKRHVRNTPWSQVFRLEAAGNVYYLKFAPPQATASPALLPKLNAHFPGRVCAIKASDPDRGLVLMHAIAGKRLDNDLSHSQRALVLSNYATMQATSASTPELLENLPSIDPVHQLDRLLEFLNPDSELPGDYGLNSNASEIMGTDAAARYFKPLQKRRALLTNYLERASQLPVVLTHGDLRPLNAGLDKNKHCEIFDWDDASAGPVGLSLHGMLSGCATIARLLEGDKLDDKAAAKRPIIDAYISTLVEGGLADRPALEHALGASACAGVMHYLLGYARFPLEDSKLRADTAAIFKKRLGDILDLCDYLALQDRKQAIACTRDYMSRGREPRAEWIIGRHLDDAPNDGEAHGLAARLLHRRRDFTRAATHYRHALEINPNDASLLRRHGDLLLEQLQFDKAVTLYRKAMHADPALPQAEWQLELAFELQGAEAYAATDDGLPTIVVSEAEFTAKKMNPAKRALAAKMLVDYGVLVIENVFEKDLIERCRAAFFEKYRSYFENKKHGDALRIGDKRFQVTMNIDGPVNDEALYANPFIMPLMRDWLDENYILGSLTASTSLPGSEEQWVHKDHPILFSNHKDLVLPPHGVSLMIPLVDLSPEVGTTKVKKKSHFKSLSKSRDMPSLRPYVDAGSCYLMDHRLTHKGEPNRSDRVRPIFNALYHRRWFRDSLNFKNQPPLKISREEYEKVPRHLRKLMRWTKDSWPDQSRD